MVLYFSGTGNSKHVAMCMKDSHTVDIKEALRTGKCDFTLLPGESVGIVCPVYYSGVPKTVLEFVRHMKIQGEITYLYCILTHGGGPGGAGTMLERELKKKSYPLHACFHVTMASNYIMLGSLGDEAKERQRIRDAEAAIRQVRASVERKLHEKPDWTKLDRFLTMTMYPLCDRYMSTKKFYADDSCKGCGACVSRCPSNAIVLENGKPKWTENKCVRCMACIRCNSVQYGKKLIGRRRYSYKAPDQL